MTEFREVKSTADDLRDKSINSSTAASMTEFREVKAPDVKVGLEVKSQLDKDRTHTNSEVGGGEKQLKNKWAVEFKADETITIIEVGGKRDTSINSSTVASTTEFREVKSTDVRVGLEVKTQLDKDRTHTNSEVGGGESSSRTSGL